MDDSLSDATPYGTEREDADDHRTRILLTRDRPALSTCLKSHTADAVWLFLPIQKRGLYRFPLFPGKENDYEMSLLQQP